MPCGLLFINNGYHDMYLPIFHTDRAFALSVLEDSMKQVFEEKELYPGENISLKFYRIACNGGKIRRENYLSIGAEAVPQFCTPMEEELRNALYIFAPDFENRTIVTVK
jgi:SLT domain-containing protein